MRFDVVVKQGIRELARVEGWEVDERQISIGDFNNIVKTEAFLERLTGFRFHIELNELKARASKLDKLERLSASHPNDI